MWTISDLASQVASRNSGQQASAINGVFGPVTEKSQSEDSLQVALVLHLERRKQSVGLLLNLANIKKLQLAVEPHSCWQSSSVSRPKTAPTTFEIGSREQRRSLWKRSHWEAFNPNQVLLNRRRRYILSRNIFGNIF